MLFSRKSQKTLRQAAAEFIFDNSPDAYFVLEGPVIRECNRGMEEFVGLPRDKLIGSSPDRLSPERQADGRLSSEAAMEHINAALTKGSARFPWLHLWRDGSFVPVEVTLLRAELDGRPMLITFWHDLRENEKIRQAEQAARERAAELGRQQQHALDALAAALAGIAGGDLTVRVSEDVAAEYQSLKTDFNAAVKAVQDVLKSIAESAHEVGSGASEITQASDDLAQRTEQQAANLEQSAAALDEVTATARKAADSVAEARKVVTTAKDNAEQSGVVVRETVSAMAEIEKSAKEINNIIGVIDEIAFQTNLLALNAGVEAARAGEAGRGFAVVATEVRALAQRSADAAKEIKTLIAASGAQVDSGVRLVSQTGAALNQIVEWVDRLNALVADIAGSSHEQATALTEVSSAVSQMDQMTQQNAAMVEQSTAASHSLATSAERLTDLVGGFRLADASRAPPPEIRRRAAPPARAVAGRGR